MIQSDVELRPNLVLLGARHVAVRAFRLGFQFRSGCFRLIVMEVVITPSTGIAVALAILDRHIRTVQFSGKISPARGLSSRTVRILSWDRELQLLEHDSSFRKDIRLLVFLVCPRLHVHVVKLGKVRLPSVESVWGERRPHEYPFLESLRQNEIAIGGVLGQVTLARFALGYLVLRVQLRKYCRHDEAARDRSSCYKDSCTSGCIPHSHVHTHLLVEISGCRSAPRTTAQSESRQPFRAVVGNRHAGDLLKRTVWLR